MSEQTIAEALRDGLRELLAADERVIVLGEDVEAGGVFRITEGLLDEFGPERIFDTPLAESGFTGAAIGAALAGLRPIVEIQFVDFILPAVNQLISEAAKMRWRSRGEWTVPLVVRAPWGGGVHGGLYHSQSFEALFAHVPGLKVVAPATPADAKALLHAAVADPDPVIFLEHKRTYRLIKAEVPDPLPDVAIGEAAPARSGDDVTLISYGLMLHECLAAAETLAGEGIECHVLDLRTIAPLDRAGHPRRRAPHRQGRHRARGSPQRRHRWRGGGADRGARLRAPRRAHRARRRPRCARDGLPPQPRSGLHAGRRSHRGGRARPGGLLSGRREDAVATLTMPQLGESVTEGTILRWLVEAGATVALDQPLVEDRDREGHGGGSLAVRGHADRRPRAGRGDRARRHPAGRIPGVGGDRPRRPRSPPHPPMRRSGAYSPAVTRLAAEHGIDLDGLSGSGAGGRVTRQDVLAAVAAREEAPPPPGQDGDTVVSLSPTRRRIAEHMLESVRSAPHAWLLVECDASALVKRRAADREAFRARAGIDLSYLPYIAPRGLPGPGGVPRSQRHLVRRRARAARRRETWASPSTRRRG